MDTVNNASHGEYLSLRSTLTTEAVAFMARYGPE